MVTIEQKLTLFSKLLNQELKEEVDKKTVELEKEYADKIAENKFKIDEEAKDIIATAKKRGEAKKIELISKGKMSSKKEEMLIKEKIVVRFMDSLVERATKFTDKPIYKNYLMKLMKELEELKDYTNPLVISMTEKDLKNYEKFIKTSLEELGIKETQIQFKKAQEDILGGLIIEDPILNMKVDMSMRSTIEESKERIVELVTLALEKAGEESE